MQTHPRADQYGAIPRSMRPEAESRPQSLVLHTREVAGSKPAAPISGLPKGSRSISACIGRRTQATPDSSASVQMYVSPSIVISSPTRTIVVSVGKVIEAAGAVSAGINRRSQRGQKGRCPTTGKADAPTTEDVRLHELRHSTPTLDRSDDALHGMNTPSSINSVLSAVVEARPSAPPS